MKRLCCDSTRTLEYISSSGQAKFVDTVGREIQHLALERNQADFGSSARRQKWSHCRQTRCETTSDNNVSVACKKLRVM